MPDISSTLPDWAIKIHRAHGSPELNDIQDVFHGPLSSRSAGLRKDDIIEIIIDSRAISTGSENNEKPDQDAKPSGQRSNIGGTI